MISYTPSSLVLSANEPERRLLSKKIRKEELHQYDRKTFLFDAVEIQGQANVRLFSPPLLNFRRNPGLPTISSAGRKLRYSIRNTALGRFSEWTLENGNPDDDGTNALELRFKGIANRRLPVNSVTPFPDGSRVLTAIQKNNEVRWITDWFHHYRERFGVDYLVLYDNGSDNRDELLEELPENTVFVDWSFPYGPTFSHNNKFAQSGALNHCSRVFGCRSLIFSFDIDELLILRKGNLDEIMHDRRVVYFSSYNVPNRKFLPEEFSFHSYAEREVEPRYYARKYVFRASSSTGVLPHYVQTQRFTPFAYFILLLRKARNAIIMRTSRHRCIAARFISAIIRFLTNNHKEPSLSVKTGYFLHFLGISTHWKSLGYRMNGDSRADTEEDPFLTSLKGDSA